MKDVLSDSFSKNMQEKHHFSKVLTMLHQLHACFSILKIICNRTTPPRGTGEPKKPCADSRNKPDALWKQHKQQRLTRHGKKKWRERRSLLASPLLSMGHTSLWSKATGQKCAQWPLAR